MATFQNQATLSYNGLSTASNIAYGELVEEVSATKTAVYNRYQQGDNMTFVLSLVNAGTTDITAASVSDNLGQYTFGTLTPVPLTYIPGTIRYYQNGVLQTAPTVTAGPPLVVSGLTIPAGGNAMLVYEASVNTYAPLSAESSITNTATVTGTGLAAPLSASATITPDSLPRLTISKSISPATVTENGQVTYTFVIQNSGNVATEEADAVVVSDTFEPILTGLAVTVDGEGRSIPTDYTYTQTTGEFATEPAAMTVPAATYVQNATTGEWTIIPGTATLTVTGTV